MSPEQQIGSADDKGAAPTAAVPKPGTREPVMSRRGVILTSALCALLVVVGGLLGWLMYSVSATQQAENARVEAAEAAAANVKLMLGYDHGMIREQMAAATEGTTGEFRTEFESFVNDVMIPEVEEQDRVVTVTVISQGTISSTKDTASVLLYVNQDTRANTGPFASYTASRLVVDMKKVSGDWKISAIEQV